MEMMGFGKLSENRSRIIGMDVELSARLAGSGTLQSLEDGWRLSIPAGLPRTYRLTQLDDYGNLTRSRLLHSSSCNLSLHARVSEPDLPGTWGFGFWNDPFGFSLGFGGQARRLPALPQTAWFMHASPPNWLSLRDDLATLPANGFFAGAFCSLRIPSILFAPALLALPLCAVRPFSRFLRRLAVRIIQQDAARVDVDGTQWHQYSINWFQGACLFCVDGNVILRSSCSPHAPLGLALWIDNQFAAWTPEGRLKYGTLENPAAWLEIENLTFQKA